MKSTINIKNPIYKICKEDDWYNAQKNGSFKGAGIDLKDGFIHFSSSKQVKETAGQDSGRSTVDASQG